VEYRERLPFGENAPKSSKNAARWGTALLTAFALLFFATPAAGSTSRYVSPATASFSLRSGNGYRILVERTRGRVSLTAVHGGRSFFAATSYTVPGKVSPQRIDARFGRFGQISVKLKTERMRKGELEEQCTGKPETIHYGVFVGTIRFRGEGGYTSVDARQATGRLSSGEKVKCVFPNLRPRSEPGAHASRQVPPSLGASQGRQRAFGVEVSSGKRRSIFFSAFSQEHRGRMEIVRNVFATAPLSSFVFASDLSSATVQPPQPFQGEASFLRAPADSTWSGTLSVDFPGRDDVRLAGPRFEAGLARDDSSSTSSFFSIR
jgi:hypothetical protein